MATLRRVVLIVLDSCGCGAAPDAARYGDEGADTLGNLSVKLGGLTLPQLLALEAHSAETRSLSEGRPQARSASEGRAGKRHKSLIMIFLCGGPPHQDMYDLKTDAPAEIRGEFAPIKTAVPGIEICELLPNLARSIIATFSPAPARRAVSEGPAWPAPITIASKWRAIASPRVHFPHCSRGR